MVHTSIIPQQSDIKISIPVNFIGKEIEVFVYTKEELATTTAPVLPKKKASDFFGILTKEEGEKFDKHIQQARNEWDRSF